MQIKSLIVQGFRSFQEQQELDFTKLRPGLYHLSGRNEVEPSLEGNGAGKSSLLEAICWGLYGRTSRNLKAGSVKSWGSDEKCAVILEVQTAAGALGIFRVWNPNTLEVSIDGGKSRVVEQSELDSLLGLSFEAYLFSIYFAQFTPAFIDLRPAEQMSIYSSVMGLNLWENAADSAAKQARGLEPVIQQSRQSVAGLSGQIEEAKAQSFDEEEKAWVQQRSQQEKQLNQEKDHTERELKEAETASKAAQKGSAKFRALQDKVNTSAREVSVVDAELHRLEREITNLQRKDLKNCPTCGQPISNKHIKEELARLQQQKREVETKNSKLQATHLGLEKELAQHQGEEKKLLEAERTVATLSADLKAIEKALLGLRQEANPFEKKRKELAARLKQLNQELDKQKKLLQETEAQQSAAQFWGKGFKELRLSLVEESLAQLSIEANSRLVELGLSDWGLTFDIERETKKGGISKGFTVTVSAPHVSEPMPWECWSGGESQRLRIASSLGFGELICSRMGVTSNVEFWDEPSTWLSEEGINNLLLSLNERAHKKGKVILLADHRTLGSGEFDGIVTVVRNTEGSHLQW